MSRRQLEILDRYRRRPLTPAVRFSTAAGVLQALESDRVDLPVNRGETPSLFEGCFTTHASIKRYNRLCEGALLAAEALSALAGRDDREALREAWTPVLFNHFHDIMDGAGVEPTYARAHRRARRSLGAARRIADDAVRQLARPAGNGRTLVLRNPLGFDWLGPVRARLPDDTVALEGDEGRIVPVQKVGRDHVFVTAPVPPFGERRYRILRRLPAGVHFPSVRVEATPDFFRVETGTAEALLSRRSGAVGSYYDRGLNRQLVAYGVPKHLTHVPASRSDLGLNVFQILDESPTPMSAWLIHDVRREESLLHGATVRRMDAGPVCARFRVQHRFRSSSIREDVLFYLDYARVDFEARIDWRERGNAEIGVPQLKVSFATGLSGVRVRGEGPFSVTERPADGLERPTQKWLDLSGDDYGFTLYNDSRYGYDALGSRARITLLRNPYEPDPETDNGIHHVKFAFAPHGPRVPADALVRTGMAFNRPPAAVRSRLPVEPPSAGLEIEDADSVVCTALRRAEHSDRLLLRLFETGGIACSARIRFRGGIAKAKEVNFLEHPTGAVTAVREGVAHTRFRSYEVKTLLIEPGP
jgi:alpha-mannosidase